MEKIGRPERGDSPIKIEQVGINLTKAIIIAEFEVRGNFISNKLLPHKSGLDKVFFKS